MSDPSFDIFLKRGGHQLSFGDDNDNLHKECVDVWRLSCAMSKYIYGIYGNIEAFIFSLTQKFVAVYVCQGRAK